MGPVPSAGTITLCIGLLTLPKCDSEVTLYSSRRIPVQEGGPDGGLRESGDESSGGDMGRCEGREDGEAPGDEAAGTNDGDEDNLAGDLIAGAEAPNVCGTEVALCSSRIPVQGAGPDGGLGGSGYEASGGDMDHGEGTEDGGEAALRPRERRLEKKII